jgi:Tetratricopeptide Repeats-Sensor
VRAFIIRPFGAKLGPDQKEIDFDAVEELLIVPALRVLGVDGRTTLDILRAGNIRVDMFQRLLTADLVVADLSIHNANVFYELGVRHALRDKRTFLLRCESDRYPFDLQTDRYFTYRREDPAASLEQLVAALRQTINSEDQDSPVFRLLPNLAAQERSRFLVVPSDFREEVERAYADKQAGDLELLAAETRGFEWESEGLRIAGRAQFKLKASRSTRVTWEGVRRFDPNDLEANLQLGTVYQRLGDLTRSDQSLRRILDRKGIDRSNRAEALSLIGRNAKARWKASWESLPAEQQRQQALRSGYLRDSYKAYAEAFEEDLNHCYSGISALAMLTIETELAAALPDVWDERFDDSDDAPRELELRKKQVEKLSAVVALSLQAGLKYNQRVRKTDPWIELGEADLCLLTTKRPPRVVTAYQRALAGADDFAIDAVHSQLMLFKRLAILEDNVKAALSAFPPTTETAGSPDALTRERPRVLLFTGHRIDDPGREKPRFPAAKEKVARQAIKEAVELELATAGELGFGIAGGASGGDILFHEVCAELGIPTRLYLALPPDQFINASVRSSDPQWVERFWRLRRQAPVRVLAESRDLPRWLQEKPDYSIWHRNNLWMLYNALATAGENLTIIALWNGEKGDGPGGTKDLLEKAGERGAKTVVLDTKVLFGC